MDAKFLCGSSNSLKSGISPKAPVDASNIRINNIKNGDKSSHQTHLKFLNNLLFKILPTGK
jgi:hypothetical protein